MPCSGLKSDTERCSGAECSRSMDDISSLDRPVWFVINPIFLPRSCLKPSRAKTSMPQGRFDRWTFDGLAIGRPSAERPSGRVL
jgi:hypothetical protein